MRLYLAQNTISEIKEISKEIDCNKTDGKLGNVMVNSDKRGCLKGRKLDVHERRKLKFRKYNCA